MCSVCMHVYEHNVYVFVYGHLPAGNKSFYYIENIL